MLKRKRFERRLTLNINAEPLIGRRSSTTTNKDVDVVFDSIRRSKVADTTRLLRLPGLRYLDLLHDPNNQL